MNAPAFIMLSQIRAARALLDWQPRDLAKAAGIREHAVRAVEAGRIAAGEQHLGRLVDVLMAAGIEFLGDRQTGRHGVVFQPARGPENWRPTGKPS